jgi:hypothetical protein
MDERTLMRLFLQKRAEFADQLVLMYPEDATFKTFRTALKGMASTVPRRVLELFDSWVVVPYGERLLAHDDQFFLFTDYSDDLGVGQDSIDESFICIRELKVYWATMSEGSRQAV